ncbi:MAG TPA: LCP family protein [Actinomycetota bacterium]|nr:LCP family protein [Actinomycetota bacterium]
MGLLFWKKEPDPFAPDAMDRTTRGRLRKRRRRRWQIAGIVVSLLLLAGTGSLKYLYDHLEDIVQEPIAPVEAEKDEMDPFNALLVGSDSREGLTEEEQLAFGAEEVGGQRADTIILAHVDPANNRVTMIQFPRDLYVPIDGGYSNKVNTALMEGPSPLVRTIEDLTGIEINHYAQVNIAGFRDIVDAIGGVEICIPDPIPFDPKTGIEVPEEETGMVKFDGERALRFVRSRNYATGDFERIANQQKFMSAALNKVTSTSTFFRPNRLIGLYKAVGDNLVIDEGTKLSRLVNIARRLRSFDPETYEAYIVPNLGTATNEAGSVVLPDEEAMDVLFDAVAANESPAEADGVPDVDPASIKVGVYNGSGIEGAADSAAVELDAATTFGESGIQIVEIGNAPRADFKKTVVRYDESKVGSQERAELIAAALPGARVQERRVPDGVDVMVIVGAEFETQRLVRIQPIELPAPSDPPPECSR